MSKPRKSKKFPHIIKAPLLDKVLCVLFVLFYFYLVKLFVNRWDVTEASNKLSLVVFILCGFIGLFILILKLFFAESILEDNWVIKTNSVLMKRRIMYEEIKDVSITGNNMGVKLDLVDNSLVRIYCGNIIEAVNVMRLIDSKINGDKKTKI